MIVQRFGAQYQLAFRQGQTVGPYYCPGMYVAVKRIDPDCTAGTYCIFDNADEVLDALDSIIEHYERAAGELSVLNKEQYHA